MDEHTESVLQKLAQEFIYRGAYIRSTENPIFCPHVNGLMILGLHELGQEAAAQGVVQAYKENQEFWSDELLYRELDVSLIVTNDWINICKTAIMGLAFSVVGEYELGEQLFYHITELPKDPDSGTFYRQYKERAHDGPVITQTNLWYVLLAAQHDKEIAEKHLGQLQYTKQHPDLGLYQTTSVEREIEERFFLDDQAIAILAHLAVDQEREAKELYDAVMRSDLQSSNGMMHSSFSESVDRNRSTYKNSFWGFASERLGHSSDKTYTKLEEILFVADDGLYKQSTADPSYKPDNSILALLLRNYSGLKHAVF